MSDRSGDKIRLKFKDTKDGTKANQIAAYLKDTGCTIDVKGRYVEQEGEKPLNQSMREISNSAGKDGDVPRLK